MNLQNVKPLGIVAILAGRWGLQKIRDERVKRFMSTRAIAIHEHGFDGLKEIHRDTPKPGPGEVVLQMRAMALNYRDLEIVSGTYHTAYRFPLVPLSDGIGEVLATGAGVTRVKPGDRAIVAFWERWNDGDFNPLDAGAPLGGPRDGVLAEQFLALEDRLVVVPPSLSDAEAASLPCAATTAWNSLMASRQLKPGQTVLLQGTGGVSLFAMQFALMAGARVIVTSGSEEKLERVRAMGACATVNYRSNPEWATHVLELTGGRGVDHVVEVGGPGSFSQSLKALRPAGHIHVIGYLGGTEGAINPLDIFRKQATVRGIPVGSRAMLEALVAAFARSQLRPVLDRTFHWTEVSQALRYLHSGKHFGKIVLTT